MSCFTTLLSLLLLPFIALFGITSQKAASTIIALPINNAIEWTTPYATLSADNFYIQAEGKIFTGQNVEIHSDPGDETYTTLEITWFENGVEMRVYIYFEATGSGWRAFELDVYNGRETPDWIIYYDTGITATLGEAYIIDNFEYVTDDHILHFDNLKVQAFTNIVP